MTISKTGAPTLVDVARESAVSLKTASRVLNNSKNVSEEKAIRVREAIESLGYRPNELARGLKAQKSAAIGMIVPNLSDPFTANAVHGLQEVARENGYAVILASHGGDVDAERSEIQTLVGRQIDGLVIAPADSRKDNFSDIIPAGVHVVTFDQLIRNVQVDSVTVTNRRSAQDATKHLVGHGLRRIVAIGARPQLYTCKERISGYKAGMKLASLSPRLCLVEHEDLLTLRGLRQLRRIPGSDIPLFSFDDFDLADMLTPALSVVQQPAEMLGREAARLLFGRLKGNEKNSQAVVLDTNLIIRQSCGCQDSSR